MSDWTKTLYVLRSLYQYCIFVITVLLCLSTASYSQEHQVGWEALAEHVADQLVPLEELSVTACPASLDYQQAASRSVIQWIENTFYSWTEYQVTPGDDGLFCIVMEQPHSGALSEEEAGVLLSASRLWVEAQATSASDDMEILDPDDPRLNMPAFEEFSGKEALEEDSSLEEQDQTPDTGIDPQDDLEPWDDGVSSLPAEDSAGDVENGVPQAVFNPDGRERVTGTRSYPWNTIAFVSVRFPNGYSSRGTAFLVSPYAALTNGHVIYNPARGGWGSSVQIAPGQRQYRAGGQVERPFGSRDASRMSTNSRYKDIVDKDPDAKKRPTSDYRFDYGALFFSERFNGISTFMPLVFDASASKVNTSGYPKEVQGETNSSAQWHGFGDTAFALLYPTVLRYRISTSGGASGSPVWKYASGRRSVIAIHAYGGEDNNGGPRLVSRNKDVITQWAKWTPSGVPVGHADYCRDEGPCSAGQGDCDSHSECRSGLECAWNVGANYGFSSVTDVCEVPLPVGHVDYCRDEGPCSAGQGDCDRDSECRSGLECAWNVGANYGFSSVTDVCEVPSKLPVGHVDYCRDEGPCSAGQGDCDSHSECRSGLECAWNVGANYGFSSVTDVCEVPLPVGHVDYCRDEGPCSAGQGDCDRDSECRSGLECAWNVGANYGFSSVTDVCEVPSKLPVGHVDYCRDEGPCSAGQGDCDSHSECRSGLECAWNVGANYGFSSVTDVCEVPLPVGHVDYCRDEGPCSAGQGDCDRDSECRSGLECAWNVGANYGFSSVTDVCEVPSKLPVGHVDYCRDEGPCSAGQGDCDSHSECRSGLECAWDVGANYGLPANYDVCEAPTSGGN